MADFMYHLLRDDVRQPIGFGIAGVALDPRRRSDLWLMCAPPRRPPRTKGGSQSKPLSASAQAAVGGADIEDRTVLDVYALAVKLNRPRSSASASSSGAAGRHGDETRYDRHRVPSTSGDTANRAATIPRKGVPARRHPACIMLRQQAESGGA